MIYTIPTIQHTGTKLLAKMFGDIHWASFNEDVSEYDNVLYLGHLTINSIDSIKKLNHPILIPLRHPYLVYESWRRRNKPISELIANFKLLVEEIDQLNPLYLPIDVDNKQEYLDKINKELNLNLSTEWEVVNSKHETYSLRYTNIIPAPSVEKLTKEIGEFLNRFYH